MRPQVGLQRPRPSRQESPEKPKSHPRRRFLAHLFGAGLALFLVVESPAALAAGGLQPAPLEFPNEPPDGPQDPPEKKPPETPPPPAPGPGGLTWLELGKGFPVARERKLPILLVVGDSEAAVWSDLEKQILKSSSVRKRLSRWVLVKTGPEAPPEEDGKAPTITVREVLGDLRGKSAVALLDFRAHVLARWVDGVPSRSKFVNALKRGLARNAELAERFTRVDADLKKARYGLEIKKYRDAVTALLRAKKVSLPAGTELGAEMIRIGEKIQELYRKGEKEAEDLEKAKDLHGAINRYESLMREFPLPDKVAEWRRKSGELWRRIYQP